MIFKNSKVYDVLKWIAMIVVPAFGTFYFALAGIWGLPFGEAVEGTALAVTTFLGTILQISKSVYDKQEGGENDQ